MVGNMGTTDRSAASDVVPALAAKRSELARLVIETERALSRLRSDLAHVEGAMKLFDCDAAACTTEARWREKVTFRYGELPMLVLHLLKSAEQPLSTIEIESWLWKSEHRDKWSFCPKAARMRAAQEER
jgi:hypothetical protein